MLKALLDLLIDHTNPPLALSGLEGDAVLSYSIDSDRFEGQAFIEMIEQNRVLHKSMYDNHVGTDQLPSTTKLLEPELAVMDKELEIERADVGASIASELFKAGWRT